MAHPLLKAAGLRATVQREQVLHILEHTASPMTAEEIHAAIGKGSVSGLSTTYRVLSQLTEHGILLKNEGGDCRAYFQLASSHQHTLHCTVCGRVVPIEGCPLAALEQRLCAETGYTITGHSLAFTGICPHCQTVDGAQAAPPFPPHKT